jgi:hypothetical protein
VVVKFYLLGFFWLAGTLCHGWSTSLSVAARTARYHSGMAARTQHFLSRFIHAKRTSTSNRGERYHIRCAVVMKFLYASHPFEG